MPITIKELLASDTISQASDKINFNFDQLLLNGGGPEGPIGSQGVPGPVGGRGVRGTQWYEDPNLQPGTNPNNIIFIDLLEGDNYLQADGTVWEYNGTAWVVTAVNLAGPQGIPGISAGFDYFGQTAITNENTLYPKVMPSGLAGGANVVNEGVPTVMIGGVALNAIPAQIPSPPFFIPFTNAYQINTNMSSSIGSEVTSLFIHQKDSSTNSITFHGGGSIGSDKFEQDIIGNLSTISLGIDDRIKVSVPKTATTPSVPTDLIGFELSTTYKGQIFYSGKAIEHYTGISLSPTLANEYSDYRININQSNPSVPPKFDVVVNSPLSTLQLGGSITYPASPSLLYTGNFFTHSGISKLFTSSSQEIHSLGLIDIKTNADILLTSFTSNISTTAAVGQISNTAGIGIQNSVTGLGNITNSVFNGAFSVSVGAGAGNQPTPQPNLAGYSYIYSINGITLETEGIGSSILLTARDSIQLTTIFGDIIVNSGDEITTSSVTNTSISSLRNITLQASGPLGSGKITLGTTLDDIEITAGRNVEILTGLTGVSGTFDVGAGIIDMFSTLNTVITATTNMNLNATSAFSVMTLTSGNNININANAGPNGIIGINSKILDVNSSTGITLDAPVVAIGLTGGTVSTTIDSTSINLTTNSVAGGITFTNIRTRPTLTAGSAIPQLGFQFNGEISPQNFSGGNSVIVTRQNPAIASGSFTYVNPSYIDQCTMNWTKVGAIVNVSGIVEFNDNLDSAATGGSIPLPVVLSISIGTNINAFFGHGTADVSLFPGVGRKMVPVEIRQGIGGSNNIFKNYFFIKHLPTGTGTDYNQNLFVESGGVFSARSPKSTVSQYGVSDVINANAIVSFSFSYRLDN